VLLTVRTRLQQLILNNCCLSSAIIIEVELQSTIFLKNIAAHQSNYLSNLKVLELQRYQ